MTDFCQYTVYDEDLLNFVLDKESMPEEAKKHIEQCASCQKRLLQYKTMNTHLLSVLYRSQCPSGTTLSYYCAGLLPDAEGKKVAIHLQECPLCASEAEDAHRFFAQTEPLPDLS